MNRIEQDTRDIIYKATLLESYGRQLAAHDYAEGLAGIAGGALRIKHNVENNTQETINGKNGLRTKNKRALKRYIQELDSLLEDLEEVTKS